VTRRNILSAGAALLGVGAARRADAQENTDRATRGMAAPRIRDISVIETEPAGVRLTVVKITTDQDGLYGYGCATFTQRADLVKPAVEKYLKPFLLGKSTDRIEDIWQSCYDSSYWKNGPVLNNAISGVDQALWDIKGRQAGMPVYQVAGGKCREAVDCYSHASGADYDQAVDSARQLMAQGFRHVRVQVGVPGQAAYGSGAPQNRIPALHNAPVFEPAAYLRRALKLFEVCRAKLGDEIELLHDMHERVLPNQAVQFCKDVERYKPFFIEDALSPEDIRYFRQIRSQCATPLAMGELFNSPHEWIPLISNRLIDYIRVHVSQAGGFTPSRKIAILGETFGVRTAWHGPGDVSPIGHAANVTLDLVCYNFGIQEYSAFNSATQEIFKGCPEMKNGYLYIHEAPGWGIEIDEKAAAKFPFGANERGERQRLNGGWGEVRKPDGTVIKQ
jgi:mannonate dehydratase